MNDGSRRGSLVVVGTGIGLIAQATIEAVEEMRRAEQLFYLVADTATVAWIEQINPTATTLADCYAEGKPRTKTYAEMADRIVRAVRGGRQVCAAFYGHPAVLVSASHLAIRRLRREGFPTRMRPAVSSLDCLFADLGLNPGNNGFQSFEATDFLMSKRRFDPTSPLALLQVGVLGEPSLRPNISCRPERLRILATRLRRHYPPRHRVVLYEASPFPVCAPRIARTTLAGLPKQVISSSTTLLVPPLPQRAPDPRVVGWFGER